MSGEARGTTVVIEADGRTTVINEPGPTLSDAEWREVVAAVGAASAAVTSWRSAGARRRALPKVPIAG